MHIYVGWRQPFLLWRIPSCIRDCQAVHCVAARWDPELDCVAYRVYMHYFMLNSPLPADPLHHYNSSHRDGGPAGQYVHSYMCYKAKCWNWKWMGHCVLSLMFFSKRDQVLVEIVNLLFDVVEKVSIWICIHAHTHTCTYHHTRTHIPTPPTHTPTHHTHTPHPHPHPTCTHTTHMQHTHHTQAHTHTTHKHAHTHTLQCFFLFLTYQHWNNLPYSSKFSWHNIFVNFVIDPSFTNFLFTKI